ncbi:hypothetical protein GCM10023193_46140 [Planotetraspora kaengkrachanensis]|uniref:Uncharacterized protein n=1 Tax=Planotetraspora kaengkrachanensis TaxID=575193 RepID=A0A8J3VCT9_9ACTN|nr:hypothetical protein Pka01_81890 [Planotetraspora kaengkrachanensis]
MYAAIKVILGDLALFNEDGVINILQDASLKSPDTQWFLQEVVRLRGLSQRLKELSD